MRSVKISFEKMKGKNPNVGDCINLARAVIGRKFNRETLIRAFNQLVSPNEYESGDKRLLISHLERLSNTVVDTEKRGHFST